MNEKKKQAGAEGGGEPSLEDYKSKDRRQALDITEYKPKEPSDVED